MSLTSHPITLKEFFIGEPLDAVTPDQTRGAFVPIPRSLEIPRIQRSYAQGRENDHATRTRQRFLKSIFTKLSAKQPITLDFVYGNISDQKLIPLDGQQRLTTLFLLHWYASRFNEIGKKHLMFDKERFNYLTRYSSRDFLIRLMDYTPDLSVEGHKQISLQIGEDEGWFLSEWTKDPTIASMLVMIDAIDAMFFELRDSLWSLVDLISFYVLDVSSMNQTDDIYVRMNSRGRQLTDFEHFKAELLKRLDEAGLNTAALNDKVDGIWADMLWPYSADTKTVDTRFLRLFRFVCMIITYRKGESFPTKLSDFDLVDKYFAPIDYDGESQLTKGEIIKRKSLRLKELRLNLEILIRVFDAWYSLKDLDDFFTRYITKSSRHESGKILERGLWADPFGSWINSSTLSLPLFSFLYAFTTVIVREKELLDSDDFRRRLRIVANLIKNSTANELVDSGSGKSHAGNRMPAIVKQIDSIMLKGRVLNGKDIDANFLGDVVDEEKDKLDYTSTLSPTQQEQVFLLEDHPIIDGRTLSVDFRKPNRFKTFDILFDIKKVSRDLLDQALLASGDYSVPTLGWGHDRYLGSGAIDSNSAWQKLLREMTKSRNSHALEVFQGFLDVNPSPTKESLINIRDNYIAKCKNSECFDWRYYYLSYPDAFQRKRFGLITLDYHRPYLMLTHYTKQKASVNTEQPFLKCICGSNYNYEASLAVSSMREIDRYNMSPFGDLHISCDEDAWLLFDNSGMVVNKITIDKNQDGFDKVDRVELFLNSQRVVADECGT